MSESGGSATQSGILFQNSIATLYLGRLCDMRQRPASEFVIQVRIEAPEHVDDIVVTYADRHHDWIQAKENLQFTGAIWNKLWVDFELLRWDPKFGSTDRIRLVIGSNISRFQNLQKLCRRASSSPDYDEWIRRLTAPTKSILDKVRILLSTTHQDNEHIFSLFSHIDIQIITLEQIEREEVPRWMPNTNTQPKTLFRLLRDRCGGHARYRQVFDVPSLLESLKIEHNISIDEPISSGVPAYREAIQRSYELIEVPGTNLSARISDLFLWPTLSEIQPEQLRYSALEDEDPRYSLKDQKGNIDLQRYPTPHLKRAVIVAGAGFGKTALLTAIAYRLSSGVWLPVLIPLPELANSGETVIEFLRNSINRQFNVNVLWDYYCENGVAAVLFDGLDELAPNERHRILKLIRDFSNRYDEVAWLLTVRDAKTLSAPINAKILTIDIFDDQQIGCFAEAYKDAGSRIDADQLLSQLRTYPDLQLLARVPLFLALILATTQSPELIPRKRNDLLENYLYIVLHPDEYKSAVDIDYDSLELRNAAELLAFMALEIDKIGLAERDAHQTLRNIESQNSTQYIRALCQCGLMKRATNWLSFTYPIIQEYLAACYLVSHLPNEIIQRFELTSRRPWAQTMQFALEKHPEADQIINKLLEQADDAFGTVLRLIGQCIINGAIVSPITKAHVGDRLAALWPTQSYRIRENIGKLLADGFTSPLPEEVQNRLIQGQAWALQSGGNEIVVACNDPEFTLQVLEGFLNQELEHEYYLYELQSAVDSIATDALAFYLERIKAEHTTKKEIESLANLVANLSSKHLSQDSYTLIVDDDNLPLVVHLAGYLLGPRPISDDATVLIDATLRARDNDDNNKIQGWHLAIRCLWQSDNPIEKWRTYVLDDTLPEEKRDGLLFTLIDSQLEQEEIKAGLTELYKNNGLPLNIQHTILLLLSYLGDEESTRKIIDDLSELNEENLYLLTSIIGKSSSIEIVISLIEHLNNIALTSAQKRRIASNLAFGLNWDVIIHSTRGWFTMRGRLRHPAILECGRLVEEWLRVYDGDLEGYLSLFNAGIELGFQRAPILLSDKLSQIVDEEPELFQDFGFDNTYSHALSTLNELKETRNLLRLDILKRCVEISTSNTALQAIPMIASFATEEALDTLLQLHRNVTENKSSIESYIEELAGRLGIRIIWDDYNLVRK